MSRQGRGPRIAATSRRWPIALALLLAVGLSLTPAATRPALAATGRLIVTSAATYTVDPAVGAVHVSVAATFKNDKPSDASFFYYWRDLSWSVHPEAANITVRDATGGLKVNAVAEDGFIDAQFRLRRNLLYRQSLALTIAWDLPAGAPRSQSTIRVGAAFATFDLWAWGDPGTSSVTAKLPAGYVVETFGSEVERDSGPDGVTVSASAIDDTTTFWASVSAVRAGSFASDALNLAGGIELVVRGWPEDSIWRTKVLGTLRQGLPELQDLIGLPWPIDRQVEVSEVYTPLLEGYAGIFYTAEDRIEISEDLDPLVIVHEASHAWFNENLFRDRWIDEGLADTYAATVLVTIGEASESPDTPGASDEGRFDLEAWGAPGRITDETEAHELYGYNASWYVMTQLFDEIGPGRMRAIFAAADHDEIAYRGAGAAETVPPTDGWQRFLDLLEEVGGSTKADGLYRDFVVGANGARQMDARAAARERYDALVDAGDSWLPPIYVREVMGSWAFVKALDRIEEATGILELRDDVTAAAGALGLEPSEAFETAYETSADGFEAAEAAGQAELEALATLGDAETLVTAPVDFVASVGLADVKPVEAYERAEMAYEAGDLDESTAAAAEAMRLVREAPQIGRERLTGVGLGVGALVLLIVAFVLVRRRRRRRLAAAGPLAAPVATREPYGTLAADSDAPPPPADADASPEGGTVHGEGPGAAT